LTFFRFAVVDFGSLAGQYAPPSGPPPPVGSGGGGYGQPQGGAYGGQQSSYGQPPQQQAYGGHQQQQSAYGAPPPPPQNRPQQGGNSTASDPNTIFQLLKATVVDQHIEAFYPDPNQLMSLAQRIASSGALQQVATEWRMPLEVSSKISIECVSSLG